MIQTSLGWQQCRQWQDHFLWAHHFQTIEGHQWKNRRPRQLGCEMSLHPRLSRWRSRMPFVRCTNTSCIFLGIQLLPFVIRRLSSGMNAWRSFVFFVPSISTHSFPSPFPTTRIWGEMLQPCINRSVIAYVHDVFANFVSIILFSLWVEIQRAKFLLHQVGIDSGTYV